MGYDCGPSGVPPSISGQYVVRPVYNISGMGVGASLQQIEAGDVSKVPPGYFWVEKFEGPHITVDLKFKNDIRPKWEVVSCYQGWKESGELTHFSRWTKETFDLDIPYQINELSSVPVINLEFIGDRLIEVHLRGNPDPQCDEIIPIWEGEECRVDNLSDMGYYCVLQPDDADGFLSKGRIGFMIKENEE